MTGGWLRGARAEIAEALNVRLSVVTVQACLPLPCSFCQLVRPITRSLLLRRCGVAGRGSDWPWGQVGLVPVSVDEAETTGAVLRVVLGGGATDGMRLANELEAMVKAQELDTLKCAQPIGSLQNGAEKQVASS